MAFHDRGLFGYYFIGDEGSIWSKIWPALGILYSALMTLGMGGLIPFSPIVIYIAAAGLVLESAIKTFDSKFSDSVKLVLFLCDIGLSLLYLNPLVALPWFVNLLLCYLPVVQYWILRKAKEDDIRYHYCTTLPKIDDGDLF